MLPDGARVIYAEDANGSIGKLPPTECEIDGATFVAAIRHDEQARNRKKRRGE